MNRQQTLNRRFQLLIALAFLAYGLIRLGVGSGLLVQQLGLLDVEAFRDPIKDVAGFLAKSSERQIVPVSVVGYLAYIALMGVVLSIGALQSLRHGRHGLSFIAAFIAMYALLFINFRTLNPKAVHLAVCAILFGALWWMKSRDRARPAAGAGG